LRTNLLLKCVWHPRYHDKQMSAVIENLLGCLRGLGPVDTRERDFVLDSCLAPFLERELGQSSLQELFTRLTYVQNILDAVDYCYKLPWFHPALGTLSEKLAKLAAQASVYKRVGNRSDSGLTAAEHLEATQTLALVETIEKVAAMATAASTSAPRSAPRAATGAFKHTSKRMGAASAAAGSTSGQAEVYVSALGEQRFQFVEELQERHLLRDMAHKDTAQGGFANARLRRLATETASCESNLPVEFSSACFVRVDEARIDTWQFIITGPEETPYAGGCFIFDLYCPTKYPQTAPKVLLQTTGNGSVRFNPNLYNCGKVCLSLLGTWQGAQGEAWDPAVSSILQVLISIQVCCVFMSHYVCTEPGL
jgi:baculoviral IAP repeat-containing protein 6